MKREFHKIEHQGALHPKRLGRFTASVATKLFMGKKTAGYNDVVDGVVAELFTGKTPSDRYYGGYMERGHDLEPFAVEQYEIDTFSTVTDGGFWTMGEYYGASPDGMIAPDGIFEGKALKYTTHMRVLRTQIVPKEYEWQPHMQMLVADKNWVDFNCFHPDLPNYVVRIMRDEKIESKLLHELELATQEAEKRLEELRKNYA
jgi:hypothetical protein